MRGNPALILLAALLAFTPTANLQAGVILDVTSFGAVPNDGNDDAAAINNAIQSAAAGDVVYVPGGTFDISTKVNVKSNMALLGGGSSSVLRYVGSSNNQMLGLANVSNVNVGFLTFDGNNNLRATQGIYATASSNLNLHDLTVKNLSIKTGFAPHGIFFDGAVTNSIIQNSLLTNIGTASAWGAGIRLGNGSSFNQVLNNTIINTGRGGILCDNDSTDLLIKNNTVSGSGGTGLGIELFSGCDRSVVEDNRIDHWLSVDESHYVAVRRNVISDKSGVHKYAGLELVDASDNVFSDNVIDGGQKLGISISGPAPKQRVMWARNVIKTASTWGVQIQGETGKAIKQYFYKNSFQETIRSGPNTLYAPQGHGVRFNGNVDNIVFDSNEISANQGRGVQISGSGLSSIAFVNNTITGNVEQGVTTSGTVTNLEWSNNTVTGNGSNTQPAGGGDATAAPIRISSITARPGEVVQFSFAPIAPPPGTSFIEALWDFGEGIPSTQLSPTHAFSAAGSYLVTVVAWDAQGRGAVAELMVDVVPLPEPASPLCVVIMVGMSMGARAGRSTKSRA